MEKIIAEEGEESAGYNVHLAHGTVRLLKAATMLYIAHLRQRRNVLATRPNISRYALESVDSQLARLEEKLQVGVFAGATPAPLLIDEIVPPQDADSVPLSLASTPKARPVVVSSIELLDPDLRARCLDLFEAFRCDGQRDRLDTVITEVTRILEDRLRKLSGAEAKCAGVDLATHSFGGARPRLRVSDVAPEQEAAHLMYRGCFRFYPKSSASSARG
jgi:hypothetical protein